MGMFSKGILFDKLLVQGTKRKIVIYYFPGHAKFLTPEVVDFITREANKRHWKKVFLQQDYFSGQTLEMVNSHQFRYNYNHGLLDIYVTDPEEWEDNLY